MGDVIRAYQERSARLSGASTAISPSSWATVSCFISVKRHDQSFRLPFRQLSINGASWAK
jgi:hypothetical protein